MRGEWEQYIAAAYSAEPEKPWAPEGDHTVFRHPNNRKWFAVLMTIPRARLEAGREGSVDIVNLKCGPILASSLRTEAGIYPAWHMNKNHWISVALDGSADPEQIKWLLDISWDLTNTKKKTPVRKD